MRDFNFFSPYIGNKKELAEEEQKREYSNGKQNSLSRGFEEKKQYYHIRPWKIWTGLFLILISAKFILGSSNQVMFKPYTKPYFYNWEIPIQQVEHVSTSSLKPPVSVMEHSNEIEQISALTQEKEHSSSKTTIEIFGFEEGDYLAKVNRPGIDSEVEISDKAARRGKRSAKLSYAFEKNGGIQRAYIDLRDKEIRLKTKVDGIGMSVYSEEELPYEVGLRIMDVLGEQYLISLSPKIDWSGWKDMIYDLREIQTYPIMVEGVYIERKQDIGNIRGSLFIDSIVIEKLQSK